MTTVVLDSADLVESVTSGKIPVPKGIAEDNTRQAAKRAEARGEPEPKETHTTVDNIDPAAPAKPAEPVDSKTDDIEGEDGLTPRQKREFTESMLKTIGKKHRAQREAEEFATAQYNERQMAEQRAEELARENAELKAKLKPAPVVEEVKPPKREDFKTDEEFEDAKVDYRVDQRLKAKAIEDAERAREQRQQEIIAQAAARVERAIELVPDFKDVTGEISDIIPDVVAGYMQRSPMFAEIAYHLAKHPDVITRLQSLAPDEQLVEIGEIKSKLQPFAPAAKVEDGDKPSKENGAEPSTETGTAPSKPRVTAPIIRPLTTGSGAQVQKDEADMKSTEVIKAWQKKHGVQLTARKRH
jgi:hypothetical protein